MLCWAWLRLGVGQRRAGREGGAGRASSEMHCYGNHCKAGLGGALQQALSTHTHCM